MHVAYRNFYVAVGCLFVAILSYTIFNAAEITYLFEATLATMEGVLQSLLWLGGVEPALERFHSQVTSDVLALEDACSDGKSIISSINTGFDQCVRPSVRAPFVVVPPPGPGPGPAFAVSLSCLCGLRARKRKKKQQKRTCVRTFAKKAQALCFCGRGSILLVAMFVLVSASPNNNTNTTTQKKGTSRRSRKQLGSSRRRRPWRATSPSPSARWCPASRSPSLPSRCCS